MKKTRILSLFMSAMMALTAVPFMAAPVAAATTAVDETKTVITDGSSIAGWSNHTLSVKDLNAGKGGTGNNKYMHVTFTGNASQGITNLDAPMLPADTYTMTLKVRKAPGLDAPMKVRYRIFNQELTSGYLTEEWTSLTVSKKIDVETAFYILVRGANDGFKIAEPYVYPFDVDDVVVKNSAGTVIFEWGETVTSADPWKSNGGAKYTVCEDSGKAVSVTGMTVNYGMTYFDFKDDPLELYSGVYRITAKIRRNDTLKANYTFKLKDGDDTSYAGLDKDNNVMYARMYAYYGDATYFGGRTSVSLYPTTNTTNQAFLIGDMWQEVSFDLDVPAGETQLLTGISMNGGPSAEYTLGFMFDEISIQRIDLHVETEIEEPIAGNLIVDGHCNEAIPAGLTDANYTISWYESGCAVIPARDRGDQPIYYRANLSKPVDPNHVYLFSFRVRTDGTVASRNQARVYGYSGGNAVPLSGYKSESDNFWIPIKSEWTTFTYRIDSNTNSGMFAGDSVGFRIQGPAGAMSELQIDSFCLIDLSEKQGLGYINLLDGATSAANIDKWVPNTMKVAAKNDGVVDYVNVYDITVNYHGVTYNPDITLEPGDYKLSFNVRTAVSGETSVLRAQDSVTKNTVTINGVNNTWKTVEIPFTVTTPTALTLFINGGPSASYIQSYDISSVSLVCFNTPEEAEGNLITNGGFNSSDKAVNLAGWTDKNGGLSTEIVDGNGVISIAARSVGNVSANFSTGNKLFSGRSYTLSFRIRTADLKASGFFRLYTFVDGALTPIIIKDNPYELPGMPSIYAVNGEWTTVTVEINPDVNAKLLGLENFEIGIYGSPNTPAGYPQLFVDDMILLEEMTEIGGLPNHGIVMMLLHKKRAEGAGSADASWTPTNIIAGADTADALSKWSIGSQKLEAKTDGELNYLTASGITVNYTGFYYNSDVTLNPGTYKLSLKLRTSVAGEKSQLRVTPRLDSVALETAIVNITNDWTTVEATFEVAAASKFVLFINGGPVATYTQNYDICDISLIDVNEKAPTAEELAEMANLVKGATTADALAKWAIESQTLEAKTEGELNYLAASNITVNYKGFTYKPGIVLEPGKYTVKCDLRSADGGTINLRLIKFTDGGSVFVTASGAWTTGTFDVEITEPTEFTLKVCGGTNAADIQPYHIANISVVKNA